MFKFPRIYVCMWIITFDEAQEVMGSDPQARCLVAPDAWRKALRPYDADVYHTPELKDGSESRRIDKGQPVALRTAEVSALVEQRAPQPPLMSVPVCIECCQACSPEQASVRRVAHFWRHELDLAPGRPS